MATDMRVERLHPRKDDRLFWVLECLREQMQQVISKYFGAHRLRTLVDFGCGNTPYRRLFEQCVERYIACDFPGNDHADRMLVPSGQLPIEDRSSDIVLSSQDLEHVPSPPSCLAEARRVLVRDGKLVLSAYGIWKYHPDPVDYHLWTSDGLRREIELAGFVVDHFVGVLGPQATAIQLWQDAVCDQVQYRLRRVFFWICQQRTRRADQRCGERERDRDACVYVVVASPK